MNSEIILRTTFDSPIDVIWCRLKKMQLGARTQCHLVDPMSRHSVFQDCIVDHYEEYFCSMGRLAIQHKIIENARFQITVLPWSKHQTRMATRIHLSYHWGVLGKLLGLLFIEPVLWREIVALHTESLAKGGREGVLSSNDGLLLDLF